MATRSAGDDDGNPILDPGLKGGAADASSRSSVIPMQISLTDISRSGRPISFTAVASMTRCAVCFMLMSAFLAVEVSAQLLTLSSPILRSDVAYSAGNSLLSYEILQEYLAEDSASYEALWRAARAAVQVGMEQQESRAQNHWLDPAIHRSEQAVILRPDGVEGLYWRGFAAGKRAMNASPSYAVTLAQVVHKDAHAILAADSLHGGAHNMLGKLNYEVMSLSWVERTIAKLFMGNTALDDTSWQNAEHHLSRAVETWPSVLLFHFDMGLLHRKRDRREEAIRSFRQVLSLGAVHRTDRKFQDEARAILNSWGVLKASSLNWTTTGR